MPLMNSLKRKIQRRLAKTYRSSRFGFSHGISEIVVEIIQEPSPYLITRQFARITRRKVRSLAVALGVGE